MATSRQSKQADKNVEQAPATPPYYIAEQPLFIGDQFSRAFNPGDHVPPGHVEQYGWHDLVRAPDGYDAPEKPSNDEPETADGQATSSKEGES
ncbi:hypothetical protein [Nonomuraea sp. SYSU D8015]|uniref:hypothetical protein n=1 Tax=Nonomuraea sp. SYSU D8015 TaxID=2593644 RepID=UPI001660B7DF|nr:hypothetical protein [Nonomuraea sp. SYSU D8015]